MSGFAMYQPAFNGDVPIAPVVPVVEYIQGSLAASAAVAGLLERTSSGVGQIATVSGIDAVGTLIATLVNEGLDAEVFRPGRNPELGPSFRSYRCGDGEMLFLATLVAPLFLKALDVLDSFDVMLIPGVDGEYLHLFMPTLGQTCVRDARGQVRHRTAPALARPVRSGRRAGRTGAVSRGVGDRSEARRCGRPLSVPASDRRNGRDPQSPRHVYNTRR